MLGWAIRWFYPAFYNALPGAEVACKDLKRNGPVLAITLKATYTPTSNRAGSRSQKSTVVMAVDCFIN